jgi:hypothetical protein
LGSIDGLEEGRFRGSDERLAAAPDVTIEARLGGFAQKQPILRPLPGKQVDFGSFKFA